ncbi:hypothetical protein [Verrucomicrobium spinosum]|uniref:hypothetical protein n=1 Tax=Verrucomicrobium spinosum TaxID=2736 RepID=UPI0001745043|nr:hypothetical protein [Verrucomicrobium spinosum]
MLPEPQIEQMTGVQLMQAFAPPPPLCVPLATEEWRGRYTRMTFAYQLRSWSDDETPPAWEDEDVIVTDIFPLTAFRLARLLWRKSKSTEEASIVTEIRREQVRWRWIWEVDSSPMAWRMVHIRWRLEERLTVNGTPSISWGDPEEHWWQGEEPEGYDVGDWTTWPGTEIVETPLPTVPEPPDPAAGINNTHEGQTFTDWLWPHRDVLALYPAYPFDGVESQFAPGFIPGAYGAAHEYGRPKSNGVFYGRPPMPLP